MKSVLTEILRSLVGSDAFEHYAEAFENETGLPLMLIDLNGQCLNMEREPRQPSLASLIYSPAPSRQIIVPNEALTNAELRRSREISSIAEVLVPITQGNSLLGYLVSGGVFLHSPDKQTRIQILHALERLDPGLPAAARLELICKTPVMPEQRLRSIGALLQLFAEHLSLSASRVIYLARDSEPPPVARARQFVAENHAQPLALKQVARVANMSPFHFCKKFKKVTGLTFTKYVSSVRVEHAKELLLNREAKVIDVAYDSGFQSLSHFNRVFRSFAGESPTSFRASQRLPLPAFQPI